MRFNETGYNLIKVISNAMQVHGRRAVSFGLALSFSITLSGLNNVLAYAFEQPDSGIENCQQVVEKKVVQEETLLNSEEQQIVRSTYNDLIETAALAGVLEQTLQLINHDTIQVSTIDGVKQNELASLVDLQFHLDNINEAVVNECSKVSESTVDPICETSLNLAPANKELIISYQEKAVLFNKQSAISIVGPDLEYSEQIVSDEELNAVLVCSVTTLPIQTIKKEYQSQSINQHVYLTSLPDYLGSEGLNRARAGKWASIEIKGDNSLSQGFQPKRSSISTTEKKQAVIVEMINSVKSMKQEIIIIALHTPEMSTGPPLLENQIFQSSTQSNILPQKSIIQKPQTFRQDSTVGFSVFQQSKSGNTSLTSSVSVIQSYTKFIIRGDYHV